MAGIPQDEAYFRERSSRTSTATRCGSWVTCRARRATSWSASALALVHMTTRPERFGLTLIEAMACGTPVLGARMGSIPEIVVDGVTGFLCDSVAEAAAKVPLLASLSRRAARAHVESTFSLDRMVDRYAEAYADALRLRTPPPATADQLRWRAHDWWDRPMAFTDFPPKPAHRLEPDPPPAAR